MSKHDLIDMIITEKVNKVTYAYELSKEEANNLLKSNSISNNQNI